MSHQIATCDFSVPRRLVGGAHRAFRHWQQLTCTLLTEQWGGLLERGVQVTAGRIDEVMASQGAAQFADPGFAARILLGPTRQVSLVVFPAPLVLHLLADMLGTASDQWPAPRDLSPTEGSLLELLCGEVARAIRNAWPQLETLETELESVIIRPLRVRTYPPTEELLRARLNLTTAAGAEEVVWLIPLAALDEIGLATSKPEATLEVQPAPQLRATAERIPVTLTIQLGVASLNLAEMQQLSVGDILLLNQPVQTPLLAMVGGRPRWRGHACRIGTRQGFRVSEMIED